MPHEESVPDIRNAVTLSIAIGGIDPASRVLRGEIADKEIDEFVDRLRSDEFYEVYGEKLIPSTCVDGRCGLHGSAELGPSAAGGTFSLVIADALTEGSYRQKGETADQHAKRLYAQLVKDGYRVGGHDDEHADGPNCGCGAEDKLDQVFDFIAANGDRIRTVLASVGVEVGQETHEAITNNSVALLEQGYVTSGAALRQAYVETAGPASVATLRGTHNEVAVTINTQPGQTLDRNKLRDVFGDRLQTFNLDVPALRHGVEATSISEDEAQAKLAAALYYNVATAAVLAGPSLRVVVR